MKANEFCYWLQGHFEIGEVNGKSLDVLTAAGVLCVKSHLDLVKNVEPGHTNVFVAWLSERLDRVEAGKAIDAKDIRRFLAAQFQHVIDPSYGGDQKKMNEIHGLVIGGTTSDGVVYRC